jgi:hypothetical protein
LNASCFGRPTASLVPWTGAPRSPKRTWAENDGRPEEAHQTISLCTKPLERIPEKLPPKRKILKGTGFSPYVNASIGVRLSPRRAACFPLSNVIVRRKRHIHVSQPICARCADLLASRTIARTLSPRCRRSRTAAPPTFPVAPKMAYMDCSLRLARA